MALPLQCQTPRSHADGKVCLVTGSSRGIGKAIALALGAEGAKVVVNYSASSDAAEEVASSIKSSGGDAMTVQCNTGSREDVEAMFKKVSEEWGTVDVLVNNAGALMSPVKVFLDLCLHTHVSSETSAALQFCCPS